MTTHKNLMTLCVAAVFAVGLAACGGGGNGDGPDAGMDDTDAGMDDTDTGMDDTDTGMDDTDTGPTDPPPTQVAVTLPDVMADYGEDVEELNVPADTYEISAGDTMPVGDVDFTCAMGGDDCSVEVMDDGTVESTGGDVSAVVTLAYLERQLAAVNERNEKLETDQAAKVASDKAKAVLAALNIAVGDSPTGTAPEDIKIAASSDGDLTVESAGYTKSAYPDAITGFRGAILTTDDAELHVYTDIEDSVATPISDIYRASSDPGKSKTYTVLASGGDNDILWPQAMRADEVTTETGTGATAVTAFMGGVRGVDGMFSCTGDNCTAPAPNADGDLTGAVGDWTFAPTDPNGTIDVADDAYLSFGWWLNKTGDDSYEVDVFRAAAGMTPNTGAGSALEGTATYRGGAAGKFAIQSTTEDSAEGGHFTASATLVANFDADSDGADDNDKNGVSISGTINDFMTGAVSRDNWKVTLMPVDDQPNTDGLQTPTSVGDISGATAVWDTGGAVDGMGTWDASFYGEEDETDHPMAATGEFDAQIGDGDIATISGAFAATK